MSRKNYSIVALTSSGWILSYYLKDIFIKESRNTYGEEKKHILLTPIDVYKSERQLIT
tara:strand:- start:598 stop:771 length:174 start_codon:yes stop_codon:yes gene_type:complete